MSKAAFQGWRAFPSASLRPVRLAAAALACAGVLSAPAAASAATFTVTTTADSNDGACTASLCSLRDAVVAADAANGSSTIDLPAGDYKLTIPASDADDPTNGDLDIQAGNAVTITGAGSATTTLDANGVDRAFAVQSGASLSLSGMTITGGKPATASTASGEGGAVYSDGALSLTNDVRVVANQAGASAVGGGAIFSDNGATVLSITGSEFDDNSAGSNGGGALLLDGAPGADQVVADSSFQRNQASDGGAVDVLGGDVTVTGSEFSANRAANLGGALLSSTAGALTAENSAFNANSADAGGGLAIGSGDASISGSTLSGNDAVNGGALFQDSSGATLSLVNNTLSGNTATGGGGAIFNALGSVEATIENDTIASNSVPAAGHGGGIYEPGKLAAASKYVNTIVADNDGGDCFNDSGEAISSTQDQGHNLDSDSSCFGSSGGTGDQPGVNPELGPLQDNGGPTMTQALQTGSPAIDAGDSTPTNCPSGDQRGVPRPQGPACDIGAFEVAGADVAVTESAPTTAVEGAPLTYTLTVTNEGPGPATGVVLTDPLPATTTLYAAGSSQGSCSGKATVTCALGVVNVAGSVTVTIVVVPNAVGTIVNQASLSANETDPDTTNNHASATTKVTLGPPTVSPVVLTGKATGIARHSARLTGIVNPAGEATTYRFLFGRSQAYGRSSRIGFAGAKLRQRNVSMAIYGLRPGRVYHYRLVATNEFGSSFGADRAFRTRSATTNHTEVHGRRRRHPIVARAASILREGW